MGLVWNKPKNWFVKFKIMVLKNRFISLGLITNHLWAKILWLMPPCMVLFTEGSNKGPDLAERIHSTAFPFNKTRRMPIMGPLLQTQLPDLPFKLDTRAVEVCGKLTLPCARVRVSRRKRRREERGRQGNMSCGYTTSCRSLEGYSEMCGWFIVSRQRRQPWEKCGVLR